MGVARNSIRFLCSLLLGSALTACGDDDVELSGPSTASEQEHDETLVVTCTADTTELDQPAVTAGPEGVRVHVMDDSGTGLHVRTQHDDRPVGPLALSEGESTVALPPGRNLVLCSTLDGPEHMLAPSETDEAVQVEVKADPTLWKRPVLDCDLISETLLDREADTPAGAGNHPGDPVTTVRAAFPWITEQDRIEKAGYPQNFDQPVQFRVQRDGTGVVAVASVSETNNGWVLEASEVCAEVQSASS